jgi:prepilin-type N-terminal cleavage/methylation domain-containing protein
MVRRAGFTFLEVLCTLLVVTIGLMGVIGLIAYGNRLNSAAQAGAIATATAISVAYDPQPRLDPAVASNWSYTPYNFNDTAGLQTSNAMGFINGMYVTRVETSAPADILARSPITLQVYARSALVDVTVYETIGGAVAAQFTTRIVRQQEAP